MKGMTVVGRKSMTVFTKWVLESTIGWKESRSRQSKRFPLTLVQLGEMGQRSEVLAEKG